jgi:hypothetical protein
MRRTKIKGANMKKIRIAGTAVFLTILFISACSTEGSLQRMLGSSASSIVFYSCKAPAEGEVNFYFSREVTVASLYLNPSMETEILGQGETVSVRFSPSPSKPPLPGGSLVSADILVEDKNHNTLNVLVSFRTRNDRMPELVINEIRTAYSKPRVEYIELKALGAGNLGAMRLCAIYDKDEPIFEFPPVEVKKGEYIVVHTRSIEQGIVNELGTNLNESKGTDASAARDFWISGSLKLHSTNVIYAVNQDDRIIDGVMLVSSDYKWKDTLDPAAKELERQGMWPGSELANAVKADGNTTTRTICRDENRKNSHSAADWYVTVTSGATPGKLNNPGRYVK